MCIRDRAKITMKELFELWKEKKAPKLGESNRSSLCSAFKHCSALWEKPYKQIRSYQMQETIDGCGKGYSTQAAIKNLWGHLDLSLIHIWLTVWGSLALLRRAFPMADRIALQATVTNFTFCKSGRANHRFTLIRYRKITTSNHSARSRPCWSKYHQTILMLSVANWASFGVRGRS